MGITNEIKAKVFALYLGQRARIYNGEEVVDLTGHVISNLLTYNGFDKSKVILKPLSKITDEDLITVSNIMGYVSLDIIIRNDACEFLFLCTKVSGGKKLYPAYDTPFIRLSKHTFEWDHNNGSDGNPSECGDAPLEAYQFLQSKGYDLPQYLLGRKTLFEAGLAIYK